ncbi:hypothetical protein BGX28_004160 [Mortierella sp. GBA30]|nr:hypothetical protein BGX28_004160 [Mortierella sp. GBA30]
MVNILQWDEFQKAAEELYTLSPSRCLKYKTDQLQDLNKFERLNRSLMAKMHNRIPSTPTVDVAASGASSSQPAPSQPAAAPTTIASPALQQGGGGKAKRNKRK